MSEETNKEIETKEEMAGRVYEIGYQLVSTLSEEEVPREVTVIKDVLEKLGAQVVSEEFPRLKPLAYSMRKYIAGKYQTFSSAYFGWIKFEAEPQAALALKKAADANEKILRYLIIKTVRENTMTVPRAPRMEAPKREWKEASAAPAVPSVPISEVDLDKSIEKLIAE